MIEPSSGDVLEKGTRYSVRWTSDNAGSYVRFDLHRGNFWVGEVAPSTINDGGGSWTADDFGHGSDSKTKSFEEFAGTKGTKRFESFNNGKFEYWSFVLIKN